MTSRIEIGQALVSASAPNALFVDQDGLELDDIHLCGSPGKVGACGWLQGPLGTLVQGCPDCFVPLSGLAVAGEPGCPWPLSLRGQQANR